MKKILVVDDETAIREIVNLMLSGRYKIITAKDGREAVEKFKIFKPDFVIMDVMMPVMNGIEAIRIMKSINPDVKIIALTAYAEKKEAELREAGVVEVISKPFRRKDLVGAIQKHL
ncbi:Response regulator receiver domain [Geoglobus ahangari]|uniref:Response regulator receiver domain n=1 Tax=Geoglobus ahangari TaxID=113653 RepID=A0A0F7ICZ2_9EURY|nr:response regulator [Geoglobus ahangari]AKG90765.1 Response regulator receiver domain [Geoglobus ahangari]